VAYGLVIFLVKLSVLLLLYGLFGVNKTMRYLIFLGIGVSASFSLELKCVDAADLQRRICLDVWIVTIVTGIFNTLVDLYIWFWPLRWSYGCSLRHDASSVSLRYSLSALCKLNEAQTRQARNQA